MTPTVVGKIVITLDSQMHLHLEGTLDNKMLCYGMLEAAKDEIRKHVEDAQRRVVVAPAAVLPHLRGNGGPP